MRYRGGRLTSYLLFPDDLGNFTFQPFLQLLVPIPHPPLEMRALEASVPQPKFVEKFRLMLETFSRLLVHRVFKKLLSSSDIVRENTTRKN